MNSKVMTKTMHGCNLNKQITNKNKKVTYTSVVLTFFFLGGVVTSTVLGDLAAGCIKIFPVSDDNELFVWRPVTFEFVAVGVAVVVAVGVILFKLAVFEFLPSSDDEFKSFIIWFELFVVPPFFDVVAAAAVFFLFSFLLSLWTRDFLEESSLMISSRIDSWTISLIIFDENIVGDTDVEL